MSMSLTKQDLAAIGGLLDKKFQESDSIISTSFDQVYSKFSKIDTQFDKIDDHFDCLEGKVENIAQTVQRIENVQQAELVRNDRQDKGIKKLRKALRTR